MCTIYNELLHENGKTERHKIQTCYRHIYGEYTQKKLSSSDKGF